MTISRKCHLITALLLGSIFCGMSAAAEPSTILIEAESFDDYGGWLDDSQFIDQMGSSFLLAHGLGHPVDDASTTIVVPEAGEYHVWVRTRDWVAPWGADGAPGRFQLTLDGEKLPTLFGTEGAAWHWQRGSTVRLIKGEYQLGLHDLTGFEGRCDAVLLTTDDQLTPANDGPKLATLRRELLNIPEQPTDAGDYDLVVVGGGIAGTCAAVSGARNGLKVALVQDRPVLGGNNSSEVRVWLQGARNLPPLFHVGDIVRELEQEKHAHYGPANTAELYEDDRKLTIARAEKSLDLYMMHRGVGVEMDGQRIAAVIALETKTGRRVRLTGRLFADCTGDGCLGYLAGADYDMTVKEGHMGRCNLWNVGECDTPQTFPRCPWALDLTSKPFPGRSNANTLQLGGWYWESGFYLDPLKKSEYIRDWNFRAAYGAWDALKNVDCVLPNHKMNWMAHISGKRESRRLMGDVVLTKSDLMDEAVFEDGCVPTGWKMDLHLPDPRYERGFEGDAFISEAEFVDYKKPFWVPYRCLYSRNIGNLFMAGRDISVTHAALGSTRVMRTGGCMGEVVGAAASLCRKHETTPRGLYENHLDDLLGLLRKPVWSRRSRVKRPEFDKLVGENVAPKSTVVASSCKSSDCIAELVIDGDADTTNNALRWVSAPEMPAWIEFTWDEPVELTAARMIGGFTSGGEPFAPPRDFVFQYRPSDPNSQWLDIPATSTIDNQLVDWQKMFPTITTNAVRLMIQRGDTDSARVWEVELYTPKK